MSFLTSLNIEDIEDKIIALLEASEEIKNNVKTIDTFNGDLAVIGKEARLFPAVYACWLGFEDEQRENGSFDRFHTFDVILMTKNLRGNKASVRGDDNKTGAYYLFKQIEKAVQRKDTGLDNLDEIIIKAVDPHEISKGVAIYRIKLLIHEYYQCEN